MNVIIIFTIIIIKPRQTSNVPCVYKVIKKTTIFHDKKKSFSEILKVKNKESTLKNY